MSNKKEFIRAIEEMLNSDPLMSEERRKALEAAKASLKKDQWMEVLATLAPFFGQLGKMIFQIHEHR